MLIKDIMTKEVITVTEGDTMMVEIIPFFPSLCRIDRIINVKKDCSQLNE